MKTETIIKSGLIAIIIVLFLIASKLNGNLKALEEEKTKNDSMITSYQNKEEDRDDLLVQEETIVLTPEQKAESLEKSAELGNKVKDLQNKYFTIDVYSDQAAFDENVKNLKACFDMRDNGSAGVPWYPISNKMAGTWTYVANTGDGGHDVLWLCRNPETGILLAYAMANYDYETGVFNELTFSTTFAGNAAITATDSTEEIPVDPIVDEVNQMANDMTTEVKRDAQGEPIVTEEPTTQSEEEMEKERSARESNLRAREKLIEQEKKGGE